MKFIEITDQEILEQNLRKIVREEVERALATGANIPAAEDKILTKKQVQLLFGISSTTLWARMRDGSISYFKVGRRVYFKSSQFGIMPTSTNDYINKQKKPKAVRCENR